MANPLSQFKDNHPVVLGIVVILVGITGAYGSFTGQLAPMLAALFDPTDLRNDKNKTGIGGVPGADSGGGEEGGGSSGDEGGGGGAALPDGSITGTPSPEIAPAIPELPFVP